MKLKEDNRNHILIMIHLEGKDSPSTAIYKSINETKQQAINKAQEKAAKLVASLKRYNPTSIYMQDILTNQTILSKEL